MKKPIPTFETDGDAEDFVARADLSEFDLTGGRLVRFELRKKDASIHLRLPRTLLDEIKAEARRSEMPVQRFIRLAIEQAIHNPRPR